MKGLGEALTENKEMRMMGGGNPAAIPEIQNIWKILENSAHFWKY